MTAITETTIAKLEAKGFARWTKGSMDRLYINPTTYGVTYERYASGKVSGGEFGGETFGACEARNFERTKVYVDLADGKLHVLTRTDFEDEIRAAVESIIAEVEAEVEAEDRAKAEQETAEVDHAERVADELAAIIAERKRVMDAHKGIGKLSESEWRKCHAALDDIQQHTLATIGGMSDTELADMTGERALTITCKQLKAQGLYK